MTYRNWFYKFLIAHQRLYELQIERNGSSGLMKQALSTRLNREARTFYEVSKRHFRPTNNDAISSHQNLIRDIVDPTISEFLKFMARDNFIETVVLDSKHYRDYIRESYQFVQKHSLLAQLDNQESHINRVIAFDGITNTLHHSMATCTRIATCSPITGNVSSDAALINKIVKFDLMQADPVTALNHYLEEIS